ncbi:MAG: dihydrofolate reductase [Gammaproteobacteria bacterium]|nr:dihydrofolate reductase [Gammaproteobacteria bacterium]MBT4493190.1 dihydrofolate reductase [Gammaproteobacteria bacterium]MBT7371552.1 dihydrofolate reductase [Gammaproteobacteria bacterium]
MIVALIAAQSENRVIGKGLDIPWKVKGEQALFKKITTGGTLIMGRKTYDSIGRPLPGRTTIVVSRNPELVLDGCEVCTSLDAAIKRAFQIGAPIFIAGGGELYRQGLDLADEIHLTTIHTNVDGDIFFPEVPDAFVAVSEEKYQSNIDYTYRLFRKRGEENAI